MRTAVLESLSPTFNLGAENPLQPQTARHSAQLV